MTVGVAFSGGGSVARMHAEALERLPAKLVGVADPDDRARAHFEGRGVPTYRDHTALLSNTDPDAALIAVPNDKHAECATAALEAGVDVLVEKPLAHDPESAERIVSAEEDVEATAVVGFTLVFKPTVEHVIEGVQNGRFGDIYDVDLRYVRRRGIPQLGSWFTQRRRAGGGPLMDSGVHLLAVVMAALDYPEVERVSAATHLAFGRKDHYTYHDMWGGDPLPDPTVTVEDAVRALVVFADGTSLALDCTWASNREPERSITLLGTTSGVSLSVHEENAVIFGTEGDAVSNTKLDFDEADPFVRQWEYFLSVHRGERDHNINTLQQGLAVQELVDDIYRSAEG